MMYYCVCEPRGPENEGFMPCPDTDKCSECGKIKPENRPVSITLSTAEANQLIKELEEVAQRRQFVADTVPLSQESERENRTKASDLHNLVQKIRRQIV